jgi:hypothetical protein
MMVLNFFAKFEAAVLGAAVWELSPKFKKRPADAPAGYKFGSACGNALTCFCETTLRSKL